MEGLILVWCKFRDLLSICWLTFQQIPTQISENAMNEYLGTEVETFTLPPSQLSYSLILIIQ